MATSMNNKQVRFYGACIWMMSILTNK